MHCGALLQGSLGLKSFGRSLPLSHALPIPVGQGGAGDFCTGFFACVKQGHHTHTSTHTHWNCCCALESCHNLQVALMSIVGSAIITRNWAVWGSAKEGNHNPQPRFLEAFTQSWRVPQRTACNMHKYNFAYASPKPAGGVPRRPQRNPQQ